MKKQGKEILTIDSSKGGNGDIWMRLVGFYVVQPLLPDLHLRICVPSFLHSLASFTFGDRLEIISGADSNADLLYTNLGIKDLMSSILEGKKFISPYQRSVIRDKKQRSVKDLINIAIFTLADWCNIIQIPAWNAINTYQGFLDIIGIKKLSHVTYKDFVNQLEADSLVIRNKFRGEFPISPELQIPQDLSSKVLVFPNGTSRQFIPVWWAKKYMSNAYYAFFHKDSDAKEFVEAGLHVIYFYKEAGDIIHLSHRAKWTISTDSFPSHLLQYATEKCTITITEVLKERIISPAFKGKVIDAVVACHPCLHLERKAHPLCAAGYSECLNWKDEGYSTAIIQ
jgi:hypothetical protein